MISNGRHGEIINQIDVLRDVSLKLNEAGIPFMLTGSVAMNYYAQPRMTRDIDVVVSVHESDIQRIVDLFRSEYYISEDAVRECVENQSIFNVIHNESVIKVDFLQLKSDSYFRQAFQRRKQIQIQDFQTTIIGIEDLIIAKLVWSYDNHSEMQSNDIKNLLMIEHDGKYLKRHIKLLHLESWFDEVKHG